MKTDPIELKIDVFGAMVLTLPSGQIFEDVIPVRCFPFTAPDEHIAICDQKGTELYLIKHIQELSSQAREVLTAELNRRDFLPVISRIHSISSGSEPNIWLVETDRGPMSFTLTSEDNVRALRPNGCIISDANGVRYKVLDTRKLDATSRRYMGRYS